MASETKHEKYRDALAKAAFGELSERGEAELLAHTAECDACREEYTRAVRLRETVDRGVSSVVAGEPSAGFEARLRARLADAPAPARWRAAWVPAGVAACAVAGLLLMIVMGVPRRGQPYRDAPPSLSAANHIPPVAAAPSRKPHRELALVASENPMRQPGRRKSLAASRPQRTREPEVIVPREQIEGFAQFAESAGKGQVNPRQLAAAQAASQKPTEIARIEIKGIEIPPLDFDKQLKPPAGPDSATFLPITP